MSPLSLAFIIILSIAAGFLLGLLFHIRRTSAEMQRLKEAEVQARTLLESERRHAAENRKAEAAALRSEFRAVAEDLIQHESSALRKAHLHTLEDLLAPLGKDIEDFRDRFVSGHAAMDKYVKALMDTTASVSREAGELARALTANNKAQGNWGEAVLRNILEASGLTAGRDFTLQARTRDDEGREFIPDVVVHLPEQRAVVIDSKVSLTAFLDYANADNEADRQRFLKTHIDSLQKHVKELSTKDYSAYVQPPKVRMDYVIMFVPHTGALWTALNAQPDLWRKAMEQNVFIADEQTLFAALRIISLTWTQIRQAENHEQVYRLANEMLDRVGQFMKKYTAIGKALKTATTAYDDAERKLQPSGQSILQTCAKLQKLGAKQSDKNPLPQLIDIDEVAALAPPADDQDDN